MKVRTSIKRILSSFIVVVMMLSLLPAISFAADGDTPYTDFEYSISGSNITLGKYKGTATTVVVPGSYVINGTTYTTVLNTDTAFKQNTSIKSVTLKSGIKFKNNTMAHLFHGCTALTTANLSAISTANVTSMRAAFRYCSSLTSLDLSNFNTSKVTNFSLMFEGAKKLVLKGYENWNTSSVENMLAMFNEALTSAQALDLSKWNLSKVTTTYTCFQLCPVKDLILPSTLPTIGSYALNHLVNYSKSYFTIPKATKEIGYAHVMYDFGKDSTFKEFRVEEGNTHFKAVDGVLYSMDGTKFVAMPRGKTFTNKTYEILEGVTFLPELCFSRNKNLDTLVLPNSYVIRQSVPAHDPQYYLPNEDTSTSANLNFGNSLSIAIYLYTSIKNYEVKADNPNYKSDRGILYSKDMSKLLAVPLQYNKDIIVPEGVERWEDDALYFDARGFMPTTTCTIKIPASVTYIGSNQIHTLNYMKNSKVWKIQIDENNPVYTLNSSGNIVQYGLSEDYITLSASSYAYDGTAKKPTVTVKATKDTSGTITTLTNGTHYTVEYIDNVQPGTAKVKITGKGSYSGIVYKTFNINLNGGGDDFGSYDQKLVAAAGKNFLTVGGTADTSWKAFNNFGTDNKAQAGISLISSNKVLSVEALGSTADWNTKSCVLYNDITLNTASKNVIKVDFFRQYASGVDGGMIFGYDGNGTAPLTSNNFYALDFVRKDNPYGVDTSGNVSATGFIKNGKWISDAQITTNYDLANYTQTINGVSRTGNNYISAQWCTLTVTFCNGEINWTVASRDSGTIIQTGSWTDPNPIKSETTKVALFSSGKDAYVIRFDNLSVSSVAPDQDLKATASTSDLRVEIQPGIIKDIEDMEKIQLIVAYYDKETNAFLRLQKKTVRGFASYIAESFKPANEGEYAKVFIWNGDMSQTIPAHTYVTVNN